MFVGQDIFLVEISSLACVLHKSQNTGLWGYLIICFKFGDFIAYNAIDGTELMKHL